MSESSKLLHRAASENVKVVESEISWVVEVDGRPDITFPKRQYPKFVADTYADGLALRIAVAHK